LRKILISICLLLFAANWTISAEQQNQSSLVLDVTFPALSDTFRYERIRIAGYATPGAMVTVNDKAVNVYTHGAFVTRVPLEPEMNTIIIQASKNGEKAEQVLSLFREPGNEPLEISPTKIDIKNAEPANDIWVMPGDYLNIMVKASPKSRVTFSIKDIAKNQAMTNLLGKNKDIYNGVIKIPHTTTSKAIKVKFEAKGQDGKKESAEAPGNVYVLPEKIPIIGMTKEPVYMHSSSKSYSPVSRLPDSVRVHITGKENERYKVRLCPGKVAFIQVEKVKILPLGTLIPLTAVSAPSIDGTKNWHQLSMWVDYPVPFKTNVNCETGATELRLYGAYQASNWTTFPNYETGIKSFSVSTDNENELIISLHPDQKAHWGHKVEFDKGKLIFSVRKNPGITLRPLENIRIAIDPGHGGENEGTTSPIGILEKDVNLRWANHLKNYLTSAGAHVFMTRTSDEQVSLEERIQRAADKEALILVSLHNNSTTPYGNPIAAKGTSTYFTLGQNKELAWAIYPHMTNLGLVPYGRVKNSYYLTNATEMLVVLIEGVFMSNPLEEKLVLQDAFLRRMAHSVMQGLEDFINERRTRQNEGLK
jgi:N-acetylmuramoyl-L-alanine amidase